MTDSLYRKQLESMKLEDIATTDLVDMLRERDKRIEKLNKENGKLEGKLADLQSEYVELENFKNNEIAGLKRKNEELKSISDFQTSSNMDRYFQLKRNKEQLLKVKDRAKKIIEYLLDYPHHAREEDFMKHIKEAIDFLTEIEEDV